jgi:3-hydroxyisobutyrate dehydrogenase-like beta-hydroxyacid dehydrogenase
MNELPAIDKLEADPMAVGFIGLGRMKQAMARNLLKAGYRVFVFNRTRSRAEDLHDVGAEIEDSPAGTYKADIVVANPDFSRAVDTIWSY